MQDSWMVRLKAAYEAGYYRTESDVRAQTKFPWQDKTCGHCPFWFRGMCKVHLEKRSVGSHTCSYFDPHRRQEAELRANCRPAVLGLPGGE